MARLVSAGYSVAALKPIEKTFLCDACGKPAIQLMLLPAGVPHPRSGSKEMGDLAVADSFRKSDAGKPALVVEGFLSSMRWPLDDLRFADVKAAIEEDNSEALSRLDPEYLQCYCRDCSVNYCRDHWSAIVKMAEDYPGFYDCTDGTCPRGHSKTLDD